MIRPEQIDGLPYIDATVKLQYKEGLTNLWNQANNSPAGSEARDGALEKIRTASARLMNQLANANRNRPNSGAAQAGQMGQQGQNRPPQQGGQPQQMNQQQPGQQPGQVTQAQLAAARARQQQSQGEQTQHCEMLSLANVRVLTEHRRAGR